MRIFAVFVMLAALLLNGCMHDTQDFEGDKPQRSGYSPSADLTPGLDMCTTKTGEVKRCDLAK